MNRFRNALLVLALAASLLSGCAKKDGQDWTIPPYTPPSSTTTSTAIVPAS